MARGVIAAETRQRAGAIGDPLEIIQIPEPAPLEAPLTLPDDWPEAIPEPSVPEPEKVPA